MNLSIITSIWKLSTQRLYETLWQLSHQTEKPLEIVVVNASPDSMMRYEVAKVCEGFPLAKCIDAPQDVAVFNLSRSSNIGIKHSNPNSEFIGVVALDLLYAPNVIETLSRIAGRDYICEGPLGNLRGNYDLGDVESLWERWPAVLQSLNSSPPRYAYSPGSISCVRRDWLMEVHGYDENQYAFSYGDSDLLHRAELCGINVKVIPWRQTQMIHIEHTARFGIQTSAPDHRDKTIIRNEDRWGEIA